MLTEQEYQALPIPCRLNLSEPGAWEATSLTGIYPDRWIAGEFRVVLRPCGEADAVAVQGFAPGGAGLHFPVSLAAAVNGQSLAAIEVSYPGPFAITIPLPSQVRGAQHHDLRIRPSQTFVPAGADRRLLSAMVETVALVRQSPPTRRPVLRAVRRP